jgi:hypothetical protein
VTPWAVVPTRYQPGRLPVLPHRASVGRPTPSPGPPIPDREGGIGPRIAVAGVPSACERVRGGTRSLARERGRQAALFFRSRISGELGRSFRDPGILPISRGSVGPAGGTFKGEPHDPATTVLAALLTQLASLLACTAAAARCTDTMTVTTVNSQPRITPAVGRSRDAGRAASPGFQRTAACAHGLALSLAQCCPVCHHNRDTASPYP